MRNLNLMLVLAGALCVGACSSDAGPAATRGTGGHSDGGSGGLGGVGAGGVAGTGGTAQGTGGQATGGTMGKGGAGVGGGSGTGGAASGGQTGTAQGGGSGSGGDAGAGGKGSGGGSSPSTGGGGAGQTGSGGKVGSGGNGGGAGTGAGGTGGGTGAGGVAGAGGTTVSGGTTGSGGNTSPGSGGGTGTTHWVGTWTASPYVDSQNPPPVSLANAVLRQIAHVSLGGGQIRVQFSNLGGNGSVTINSAHIALSKSSTTADSNIDTATDKALAFSGKASVTIAEGKEVWSDPIDFNVANQSNVTITTAFGSVPSTVVGHSGSRTTSYIKTGSSDVSTAGMTGSTTTDHWFYISGIDVMADTSAVGVVAIGDSITDGRGTDTNKNNRWTDIMAARLQANAATAKVATMNQGIGATNLVGTSGTAAQARYARDVLGQSGVKYVIVFDGVNDMNGGASLDSMKNAYADLIKRAHDKGLTIYGATILPFGGSGYASHESLRQQVNTYIKSGVFDGVIDFDAALKDPSDPTKMQASYAAWAQQDWLHPGPAGYQKMGESVDLTLFTK